MDLSTDNFSLSRLHPVASFHRRSLLQWHLPPSLFSLRHFDLPTLFPRCLRTPPPPLPPPLSPHFICSPLPLSTLAFAHRCICPPFHLPTVAFAHRCICPPSHLPTVAFGMEARFHAKQSERGRYGREAEGTPPHVPIVI